MANLQACKLLCVTMLILGPCINGKVNVSFVVNLEEDAKKRVFKKILIEGLLQCMDDNFDDLDYPFLKYILASIEYDYLLLTSNYNDNDDENQKFFERLEDQDLDLKSIITRDNLMKAKKNLKEMKTDDFYLNVNTKIEEYLVDAYKNLYPLKKELKLESINFDIKNIKEKIVIIGNEQQFSHKRGIVDLYNKLLKGFNYGESLTIAQGNVDKLADSDIISLNIASIDDITPVFNQSGQHRVQIL